MPLEVFIPARQVDQAPVDAQGFEIDTSRPILDNPDGSFSTELGITVNEEGLNGGRFTNIPSIVDGRRVGQDEAVRAAIASGKEFPSFDTVEEGVAASKARSAEINEVRNIDERGEVSIEDLRDALSNADANGFDDDATELADEIFRREEILRSRRAERGQSDSSGVGPLGTGDGAGPAGNFALPFDAPDRGGSDFALPFDVPDRGDGGLFNGGADPLSTVSTEINGVAIPDQLRQRIHAGRSIADPREKRLETVRIGARIQALSMVSEDEEGRSDRTAALALLRGIGAGQFGLGDLAAAAGTWLGTDLDMEESFEYEREFRRALEEQFPGQSFVGELTGAVLGGLGVVKGAKALASGTKAEKLVKTATVFTKGGGAKGFAKNALRASVAGSAAGAATEGITEGKPLQGAVIGAAAGPLGAGAVSVIAGTAKLAAVGVSKVSMGLIKAGDITPAFVKRFLGDPATRGLKILAKKLGETEEEMGRRFLEFQMAVGRVPNIGDISNKRSVIELRELIQDRASSTDIVREAAETSIRGRRAEVAKAISRGRSTGTVVDLTAARKKIDDIGFGKVRAQTFTFEPEDIVGILENRDVTSILPGTARDEIREAIKAVTEKGKITGPIQLGGNFVEDLRLKLGSEAEKGAGFPFRFLALKKKLEEFAFSQYAPYRKVIANSKKLAEEIEALHAGRGVTTPVTSAEFTAASRATTAEGRTARAMGARTELTDTAIEGTTRATRLAGELSEEGGLVERLRENMPAREVDNLVRLGRVIRRSAQNIDELTPAIQAEQEKAMQDAARDLIGAGVVVSGNTGGAFKATLVTRIVGRVANLLTGRSKKVIDSIARDILDPSRTDDIIKALRRADVSEADILDLFVTSIAAANAAAAQ